MSYTLYAFLLKNYVIILFYLILSIVLFIFRKKIIVESKFILLYKTKLGIRWMDYLSKKHKNLVKVLGYCGIGFGFAGMIFILWILIKNSISLFIKPTTQQAVSLVLPGTSIPGVGVLNFSFWVITIFIIAAVHEFSHGIVARANGIKVKSSGIVFFGPIIGAFVEPSEKQLNKADDTTQYSVFAAGPFSNMLLAGLTVLLLVYMLIPMFGSVSQPNGISFSQIQTGMPAYNASLKPGIIINQINNQSIKNSNEFVEFMFCTKPNQSLVFKSADNRTFSLITTASPENPNKGYIGVVGINDEVRAKPNHKLAFRIIDWFIQLLKFLGVLSLGIGIFNLLPLGIVDGGRMLKTALVRSYGKNKGINIWKNISILTLIILLISLLGPAFIKMMKFL